MKISYYIVIIVFLFVSCTEEKNEIIDTNYIEDDIGNLFLADSIPSSIITLAPNLTEMIYYLGLEEKLIGNTLFCNYPPASNEIEKVGDLLSFNYEKIVSLKPDLILMTVEGNTKDAYEKLTGFGLNVFVSNPRNYNGIKKTIIDLGKIFRIENKAEVIIEEWTDITSNIKEEVKTRKDKTAMFLVSVAPVMLAGSDTFLDELLKTCGLFNIASDAVVSYPVFSREEILRRNPDYIIIAAEDENIKEKLLAHYNEWNSLTAIKENNTIAVDPDTFLRPGPRFVEAVLTLHNLLKAKELSSGND